MSGRVGGPPRIDVEWVAMAAGLKPANRITASAEEAVLVEARLARERFAVVRAPLPVEFPGRPPSVILYVARDPARARALAEAEAPLLPPAGAALSVDEAAPLHERFGALLGFPDCCVARFVERLRRGVTRRVTGGEAHEDFVAAEAAALASERFLGRLNDLSIHRRVRLVTFYPCRYDCPRAAAYAGGVHAAASARSHREAAELKTALLGKFSIASDGTRGESSRLKPPVITLDFESF